MEYNGKPLCGLALWHRGFPFENQPELAGQWSYRCMSVSLKAHRPLLICAQIRLDSTAHLGRNVPFIPVRVSG